MRKPKIVLILLLIAAVVVGATSCATEQAPTPTPVPTAPPTPTAKPTPTPGPATEVKVGIEPPAEVAAGSEFTARVTIAGVTDFCSCQFNITYDPAVIEVTDVTDGLFDSVVFPVDMWGLVPAGTPSTTRVLAHISPATPVAGSGYVAEIHFNVVGSPGSDSNLVFSAGELYDSYGKEITPVTWADSSIHIGE
jgi:hypothetical protein